MYNLSKQFVSSLKARVYKSLSYDESSAAAASATSPSNPDMRTPAVGRKRTRDGETTPTLSFTSPNATISKINYASTVSPQANQGKPLKRVRIAEEHGIHDTTHVATLDTERFQIAEGSVPESNSSLLLDLIPQDVLQTNICSYLTDARDYYAIQMTCKKFHEVSDETALLREIDLTGEAVTGKGCILFGVHVPSVAVKKLYKFAAAGNQQAMYMTGMIAAYCHGDKVGVMLLRQNANKGCLRSAYTLGLILRDRNRQESDTYLQRAISVDYLPACQELLSSQEVKSKFGDLDSNTLKNFFDPISLNRLLGRMYLQSAGVRSVSTSHCWNPCCGRWALKATQNNARGPPPLQFPSKYLPALSPSLEHSLLKLVEEDACDASNGITKYGSDMICGENAEQIACSRPKNERSFYVSRMKMCSSCRRAKYCSKLCQVYDWRSGQHKMECQYL